MGTPEIPVLGECSSVELLILEVFLQAGSEVVGRRGPEQDPEEFSAGPGWQPH
jgi:hypothetical protein